jgi:Stability determinant
MKIGDHVPNPQYVPSTHDTWFRAKVEEALNDLRSPIPHSVVEAHFRERRAAARLRPKRLKQDNHHQD